MRIIFQLINHLHDISAFMHKYTKFKMGSWFWGQAFGNSICFLRFQASEPDMRYPVFESCYFFLLFFDILADGKNYLGFQFPLFTFYECEVFFAWNVFHIFSRSIVASKSPYTPVTQNFPRKFCLQEKFSFRPRPRYIIAIYR